MNYCSHFLLSCRCSKCSLLPDQSDSHFYDGGSA